MPKEIKKNQNETIYLKQEKLKTIMVLVTELIIIAIGFYVVWKGIPFSMGKNW